MKSVIKRNTVLTNVLSAVLFFIGYLVCCLLLWSDIEKIFSPMLGEEIKFSVRYIISSSVFTVILLLLVVFGFWFKNKFMVALTAAYGLLIVFGLILLTFFTLGQITNETLSNIVMWLLAVVLAPVYGFMWIAGAYSFILLIPLLICSVVLLIKMFVSDRKKLQGKK